MNPANEIGLIQASLRGDQKAFGQIVEHYQSLICTLAYSATGDISSSEDLAQETFVTAWQRLPKLQQPDNLRGWLCGIARNHIKGYFRSKHRRSEVVSDVMGSEASLVEQTVSPDAQVIEREEQNMLWEILSEIPETYREPLVLFYREEQSVSKVAELMAISEDAVKQRLSRGRKMLRETVSDFVETALTKSKPGSAFVVGVLALLPSATAQAMGLAATTATAKGTAGAVKLAAAAPGFWAIMMGPLLGVLGAVFGARASLNDTRSPRERKFMWGVIGLCTLLVVALLLTLFVVRVTIPAAFSTVLFQSLTWSVYGISLVWLILWSNRRQRAIRCEEGTMTAAEEKHVIQPVSVAAFRGSQAGSIFGSTCWIWIAAILASDWITCLLVVAATLAMWWLICFPLLKENGARQQLALYRLAILFSGGLGVLVVSLRWTAWQATPALHSMGSVSAGVVNLLLIGITLALLLMVRLRDHHVVQQ